MKRKNRLHCARVCSLWRAGPRKSSNHGTALVFVLWLVVLLTAIAFQMTYRGHLRMRITATTGESTQARFLARSGVEMAISDLVNNAETAADQAALRDDSERLYKNIELANGAYTLFAGAGGSKRAEYGLVDECAKININTADVEMLRRLTVLENGVAEAIIALREEEESFGDLNALLLIEGIDEIDLYGEDQNGNGILDSNEDDGDDSWPPDNGDGRLEGGLAAYLTTFSAARDVDKDGLSRISLKEATAEEIVAALPDLTQQQADSIVHHRENNEFSSIMDLLDVNLIEKVKKGEDGDNDDNRNNQRGPNQGNPQQGQNQQGQQSSQQQQDNQNDDSSGDSEEDGEDTGDQQADADNAPPDEQPAGGEKDGDKESEYTIKETGQNAFDEAAFRKIADRITAGEGEPVQGCINVNTARTDVLACLPDIDDAIALAIVQERQNRVDGFETVLDLLDVRGMDNNKLKGILSRISVRSDVYRVRSFGVLRNSRTFAVISAVLDRTDETVQVQHWKELG